MTLVSLFLESEDEKKLSQLALAAGKSESGFVGEWLRSLPAPVAGTHAYTDKFGKIFGER